VTSVGGKKIGHLLRNGEGAGQLPRVTFTVRVASGFPWRDLRGRHELAGLVKRDVSPHGAGAILS
jgi:hypothetical protein